MSEPEEMSDWQLVVTIEDALLSSDCEHGSVVQTPAGRMCYGEVRRGGACVVTLTLDVCVQRRDDGSRRRCAVSQLSISMLMLMQMSAC